MIMMIGISIIFWTSVALLLSVPFVWTYMAYAQDKINMKRNGIRKFISFKNIFNDYNIKVNEIEVELIVGIDNIKHGKLIKRIFVIDNKINEDIEYIPNDILKDTIFKEDKIKRYKIVNIGS